MKPTLLILAAGMGSRYGGLKQIDGIGPANETILEYSIYDAIQAGFGKVVFVIRKSFEEAFKAQFSKKLEGKIAVDYVFQEVNVPIEGIGELPERSKPWGTGHAVLVAAEAIQEPFALINADDYYGSEGFQKMADFLSKDCNASQYATVAYYLKNTLSDFGTVSRGICEVDGAGHLTNVVERTKIGTKEGEVFFEEAGNTFELTGKELVSMNFWGCHPTVFDSLKKQFKAFVKNNHQNPKSEFYIPFAINELIQKEQIQLSVLPNAERWQGITYKEDKPIVQKAFSDMATSGKYPSPLFS